MSAQVYSLPRQTEARKKAFFGRASIDLCSKLSSTYGDNVKHYKNVHHPLSTLPVGIGTTLAVFKPNK